MRDHPSQWVPGSPYRDKQCNARIIDHFVVEKALPKHVLSPKPPPQESPSRGSLGVPPLFPGGRLERLVGGVNGNESDGHAHSYSI